MKRYHIIIKTILGILGNLLFASCVDDNIEQNYSELNELVLKMDTQKALQAPENVNDSILVKIAPEITLPEGRTRNDLSFEWPSGRKGIIQPYGIFTAHPIHWFIM